ncbi:MAG: hypothetical protein IJU76_05360 [Desulfovibrionaceae bacterium]|nr:hypothetical protein [Desulfovibrionaceae bacterium]
MKNHYKENGGEVIGYVFDGGEIIINGYVRRDPGDLGSIVSFGLLNAKIKEGDKYSADDIVNMIVAAVDAWVKPQSTLNNAESGDERNEGDLSWEGEKNGQGVKDGEERGAVTGNTSAEKNLNSEGVDLNDKQEVLEYINKFTHGTFPTKEIKEPEIQHLNEKSKEEWLEFAKRKIVELQGVSMSDPLEETVFVAPGDTETLEEYALHLIAGSGKTLEDARVVRASAVGLIKETIEKSQAIIIESPREPGIQGRKRYVSVYKLKGQLSHSIIVGVEPGQNGRVITSFVVADSKNDKTAAFRDLKKSLKTAAAIKFLEVGQSEHPRPTTQPGVSTTGADLHAASKTKIPPTNTTVNPQSENSGGAGFYTPDDSESGEGPSAFRRQT